MSRRIVLAEPGALRIEQRTRVAGAVVGTDVSGPACIYAHVRVTRGRIVYVHADTRVVAPPCFAVFLPPFSIIQAWLERCDVTSIGLAFIAPPSFVLPGPALLPETSGTAPVTIDEVLDRVRTTIHAVPIARERAPG